MLVFHLARVMVLTHTMNMRIVINSNDNKKEEKKEEEKEKNVMTMIIPISTMPCSKDSQNGCQTHNIFSMDFSLRVCEI